MKNRSKLYSGMAIMVITLMMSTGPFFANNSLAMDKTNTNTAGMHNNEDAAMKGGYSILGSKFIGMEVENSQGEDIGEVKDIMIDSKGKVRYAAVSYGGFLGMGDELYAVPMDAFTFKRDTDMFYDDVTLILDITEDQLKDEKGFDANDWPNLDDETYRKNLDTRYGVNRHGVADQPAVKN